MKPTWSMTMNSLQYPVRDVKRPLHFQFPWGVSIWFYHRDSNLTWQLILNIQFPKSSEIWHTEFCFLAWETQFPKRETNLLINRPESWLSIKQNLKTSKSMLNISMQMVSFSPQISREKTRAHSWKFYLLQSDGNMPLNAIGLLKRITFDICMRSDLRKLS